MVARRLDVAKETAVRGLVAAAVKKFGRIDVLINNAAVLGPRAELLAHTAADWRAALETNLTGAFVVLKTVAAEMLRTGPGSIINVTSGAGRHGRAGGGVYAASKFGLEGLTQVAAAELKDRGIRVNALNPLPTRTAMRAAYAPDENPAELKAPEDLAWAFFELAAPRGDSGKSYDVDMKARRLVASK